MVRPKFVGLFSLSEGKKNHGFSTSPHTLFFFLVSNGIIYKDNFILRK